MSKLLPTDSSGCSTTVANRWVLKLIVVVFYDEESWKEEVESVEEDCLELFESSEELASEAFLMASSIIKPVVFDYWKLESYGMVFSWVERRRGMELSFSWAWVVAVLWEF